VEADCQVQRERMASAVSISSPTSSVDHPMDHPIDFSIKPVCHRVPFDSSDHHRLSVIYNPQMPHLSHTSFGSFPHLLNPLFTASLMGFVQQDASPRKPPREPPPSTIADLRHANHSPSITHVSSSTSDSDSHHSHSHSRATSNEHCFDRSNSQVIVRNDNISMIKRKKEVVKDDAYWERRRKNNDAAKRSRDTRRQKEDDMALRAALLEQENIRLRLQLEQLRAETDRLRLIVLNPSILSLQHQP